MSFRDTMVKIRTFPCFYLSRVTSMMFRRGVYTTASVARTISLPVATHLVLM